MKKVRRRRGVCGIPILTFLFAALLRGHQRENISCFRRFDGRYRRRGAAAAAFIIGVYEKCPVVVGPRVQGRRLERGGDAKALIDEIHEIT